MGESGKGILLELQGTSAFRVCFLLSFLRYFHSCLNFYFFFYLCFSFNLGSDFNFLTDASFGDPLVVVEVTIRTGGTVHRRPSAILRRHGWAIPPRAEHDVHWNGLFWTFS